MRLDFTITDTYASSATPTKKTVSLLVLSGQGGMIRTTNNLPLPVPKGDGAVTFPFGGPTVPVVLNVDASARVFPGDAIRVSVTFEYTPAPGNLEENPSRGSHPAGLTESLTVVLRNGKPLLVSQSADPVTSRTVRVELTATVVK